MPWCSARVSQIRGSSAAAGKAALVSNGCARPIPVEKYQEHTEWSFLGNLAQPYWSHSSNPSYSPECSFWFPTGRMCDEHPDNRLPPQAHVGFSWGKASVGEQAASLASASSTTQIHGKCFQDGVRDRWPVVRSTAEHSVGAKGKHVWGSQCHVFINVLPSK